MLRKLTGTRKFATDGILSRVKDTIATKIDQRRVEKQDKTYKEQIQNLIKMDPFDLKAFKQVMEEQASASGASGWKAMLPGVSSMPGISELKLNLAILESLPEDALTTFGNFEGKSKRIMVEKSGQSPEMFNNMLRQYSQLAMLHAWLQYRIEKNMSIPETNDETTRIMSSNTDGFKLPKRLKPKKRRR